MIAYYVNKKKKVIFRIRINELLVQLIQQNPQLYKLHWVYPTKLNLNTGSKSFINVKETE